MLADLLRNGRTRQQLRQRDRADRVVHFGGYGDGRANCLRIMDGWNYTIRLYRSRPEAIDGTREFPAAEPISQAAGRIAFMSYVAINVLSVPEGRGEVLEQRFAGREGSVEKAPGFERFELLRPIEGTDDYLVYTRWSSRQDFEAWTQSQAFDRGHAQASGRPATDGPAATGSTIWSFEIVQSTDPI